MLIENLLYFIIENALKSNLLESILIYLYLPFSLSFLFGTKLLLIITKINFTFIINKIFQLGVGTGGLAFLIKFLIRIYQCKKEFPKRKEIIEKEYKEIITIIIKDLASRNILYGGTRNKLERDWEERKNYYINSLSSLIWQGGNKESNNLILEFKKLTQETQNSIGWRQQMSEINQNLNDIYRSIKTK